MCNTDDNSFKFKFLKMTFSWIVTISPNALRSISTCGENGREKNVYVHFNRILRSFMQDQHFMISLFQTFSQF